MPNNLINNFTAIHFSLFAIWIILSIIIILLLQVVILKRVEKNRANK